MVAISEGASSSWRGFFLVQTSYSHLGEAFSRQDWQNPAMKSLLTAVIVLLAGVVVLLIIPYADIVPDGVRAVLDKIANIW